MTASWPFLLNETFLKPYSGVKIFRENQIQQSTICYQIRPKSNESLMHLWDLKVDLLLLILSTTQPRLLSWSIRMTSVWGRGWSEPVALGRRQESVHSSMFPSVPPLKSWQGVKQQRIRPTKWPIIWRNALPWHLFLFFSSSWSFLALRLLSKKRRSAL